MAAITFNVTAQEAQRILNAVTKVNGSTASNEDARQFIIQRVKRFVLETERENYLSSYTEDPFNPT